MNSFNRLSMTEHLKEVMDKHAFIDWSDDDLELLMQAEDIYARFQASPYRTYQRLDKFQEHVQTIKSTAKFLSQYVDNDIQLSTTPIHPEEFKQYVKAHISNPEAYKAYYDAKRFTLTEEMMEAVQAQEEEDKKYENPSYYLSEEELEELYAGQK